MTSNENSKNIIPHTPPCTCTLPRQGTLPPTCKDTPPCTLEVFEGPPPMQESFHQRVKVRAPPGPGLRAPGPRPRAPGPRPWAPGPGPWALGPRPGALGPGPQAPGPEPGALRSVGRARQGSAHDQFLSLKQTGNLHIYIETYSCT